MKNLLSLLNKVNETLEAMSSTSVRTWSINDIQISACSESNCSQLNIYKKNNIFIRLLRYMIKPLYFNEYLCY
ncbi:MAG: hypothetical protein K0R54_632 [Clostridiaceae bacterium]|jgi:Ser-tRNA(Ala) deacylase AlaX|nr:hypothetical protein [Clostridiaceae bacterium]